MTWSLAQIFRHPVKSLGEQEMASAELEAGKPMPWDRVWAVAHAGSEWNTDAPGWLHCRNFVTQRHVPSMSQTKVVFDETTGVLTLTHPDRPEAQIRPGTDEGATALTEWLAPLAADRQKGPYQLAEGPGVFLADGEDNHVSLVSIASRTALEQRVGQTLPTIRFRMNLWIDGPNAWSELDWTDREISVGAVRLKVVGRCDRCNSTNANPATGTFDTQIPKLMQQAYGHFDFGVHTQVVQGGTIRRGDAVHLV